MFYFLTSFVEQFKHKSVLLLVLANLAPLYGVYYLGWNIAQIVILYWAENVVIGFYNILKIIYNNNTEVGDLKMNGQQVKNIQAAKVFIVPFFIIHYGMFCFVHGIFIGVYFIVMNGAIFTWNDLSYLAMGVLMLFISHGVSFMANYMQGGERFRVNVGTLMFLPYVRIVIMQLVIIFGGLMYMSMGKPDGFLYLLIIFKIIADVIAHSKEHMFSSASSRK